MFEGPTFTFEDIRFDYTEVRWITFGWLRGRMTAVVWTGETLDRRIISMRKCNEREQRRYQNRLG